MKSEHSTFKTQPSALSTQQSECQNSSTAERSDASLLTPNGSKTLIEFPISTIHLLGLNLPISGGGYFRLFPYSLTKRALKTINDKENMPFMFYVHPWEFDVDQPRIKKAGILSKFRHYVNLNKTEDRFKRLLNEFNFSSIKESLDINSRFTL